MCLGEGGEITQRHSKSHCYYKTLHYYLFMYVSKTLTTCIYIIFKMNKIDVASESIFK